MSYASTRSDTEQSRPARQATAGQVAFWAVLGLWGLAQLRWLAMQAQVLWQQPHYQFFPLAVIGAVLLAVRGARALGPLEPGSRIASIGLLFANAILLIIADRLYSPGVATVAVLVGVLGMAVAFGGMKLVAAVAPAWAFLWVLVRPPLGLDTEAIFRLQTLATRLSSSVLDVIGVDHLTAGHVIEIAGRRLLIEEACSGIQSLFVVVSCTIFFVFWTRASWLRLIVLLPIAAFWVIVGNITRIVTVASVDSALGINLGTGWRHELLGFVILLGVLGLIASTDQLLKFAGEVGRSVAHRVVRSRERYARRTSVRPITGGQKPGRDDSAYARANSSEPPSANALPAPQTAKGPTRLPGWRSTSLGARWVLAALALVAVVSLTLGQAGLSYAAPVIEYRFEALKADDMPETWGLFRRTSFAAAHQGPRYGRGEFLRKWVYQSPAAEFSVAVSYPFVGWHELTDCYQAEGWFIDSRTAERDPKGDFAFVRLSKPLEKSGLLWFGFDDGAGAPHPAPTQRGWQANLRERLGLGWWRSLFRRNGTGDALASYQVQLLMESSAPLSTADEAQARQLVREARETFRQIQQGSRKP